MSKLHELLAAEPTRSKQVTVLLDQTQKKFAKSAEYYNGFTKTLKLTVDGENNDIIERAESTAKSVITNVPDTLEYLLGFFATAEDVRLQKALTNQVAKADITYRGEVFATDVPVDELLGLERRLAELRGLISNVPTLDSNRDWVADANTPNQYRTAESETTAKTEKVTKWYEASPATDKHPAQLREGEETKIVGKFTRTLFSGAATVVAKAQALADLDELIIEVTNARMRANSVDVVQGSIGGKIANLVLANFK